MHINGALSKTMKFSIIAALAVMLIILYFLFALLPDDTCVFGYPPLAIRDGLREAQAVQGHSIIATSKGCFRANVVLDPNMHALREVVESTDAILFECSPELSAVCAVENGSLKTSGDFIAKISICCENDVCNVKIGEETAKC
jgi:hypothetical protein